MIRNNNVAVQKEDNSGRIIYNLYQQKTIFQKESIYEQHNRYCAGYRRKRGDDAG